MLSSHHGPYVFYGDRSEDHVEYNSGHMNGYYPAGTAHNPPDEGMVAEWVNGLNNVLDIPFTGRHLSTKTKGEEEM